MIEATRKVTARDFLIFQAKLLMDGLKDLVLFNVSIVALILDVIAGGGRRPRVFYSVLRASERFDLWLNLNGALLRLDAGEDGEDGLFGVSAAGSDTLLGQIEQLVRGGDRPRGASAAPARDGPGGSGASSAPRPDASRPRGPETGAGNSPSEGAEPHPG